MEKRIYLNDNWQYIDNYDGNDALKSDVWDDSKVVRIPHTVKEVPFHYFDESEYQKISAYRNIIPGNKAWEGKRLLLTFDGVAHDSKVFVNGNCVGTHHCGYTAFTIDITDSIRIGEENEIVVVVDSHENLNIPPFGYVIDYMTYGGIYRDVYLDIKEQSFIQDVFIKTRISKDGKQSATDSQITIVNPNKNMTIRQSIKRYKSGEDFQKLPEEYQIQAGEVFELSQDTGEVELWDVEKPILYILKTELIWNGNVIDEKETRFGYRTAEFHSDGFYLNGKKLKIRGLNRHQSFAYVGYAMPKSMQELDANILKYELGVNAVRTSHYPQSHYFIDRCDELGLLVFTEIPGWQHIGDAEWKNQAVENTKDMIMQYRNHTSIVLWGVRINESVDDDEFYERTNAVAHKLDPTRQTGGVRCYKKGSFLEDVYTYNDFSHTGNNAGCEKKMSVSPDKNKPYLVSEYNGHMYPCKPFDWEEHRMEHAIRHANVLNSVAEADGVAGSFGWCMFDYNTHKDFGSGDRICYHGVMDMFRNPKMAAYVYACQQEETPILELSSSMDIGEHPGSNRGDVYIFTNADSVKMYKNGTFIKEYRAENSTYKYLKHGPIRIDDYIGSALEENEKMSHSQAETVKELLNETARVGLPGLSKKMYLKAAGLILRYHMNMADAVALFNKYIGDWGGTSTTYRFEAVKGGEVVKELLIQPMSCWNIAADIDHEVLKEDVSYDVAAIRIRAVDENNNVLHFFNDPVEISVDGPVEIIGPRMVSLQGGMGGTYIRTTGKEGEATILIKGMNGCCEKIKVEVRR